MINRNFICIIGGAGHVGAPLGLALSSKGYNVALIDKNQKNIKKINNGIMPFVEDGCEKLLKKMIYKGKIFATSGTTGNTLKFQHGFGQGYFYETEGDFTLEDLDGNQVVKGSAGSVGQGGSETLDEL